MGVLTTLGSKDTLGYNLAVYLFFFCPKVFFLAIIRDKQLKKFILMINKHLELVNFIYPYV